MALQRVQADSISRRAVTAREGSLSLGVLSRVFLGLEFYGVYLPFLQLICFMPTGGGFSSYWFPFLWLARLFWASLARTLVQAPCLFSSPFLGCFLFYKVWQDFITQSHYLHSQTLLSCSSSIGLVHILVSPHGFQRVENPVTPLQQLVVHVHPQLHLGPSTSMGQVQHENPIIMKN